MAEAWQTAKIQAATATAKQSFADWLPTVSPNHVWSWPHIAYVRQHLDLITSGQLKRLMIFMPPRHGKSDLATIRYSAFRIESNPQTRVIIGAYNQTLANKFSRRSRTLAKLRGLSISTERESVEEWETLAGGGLRAVGVGAGVTGHGGDLIVIDDPVKNREEAESEAYRNRCWDWYTNDLYTRLEPGGAIILIMTRWHQDDLAGRILASEQGPSFKVINLPAEAEENDALGRSIGAALCPERFDLDALHDIKKTLRHSYHALYQQRPQPREGGMFKAHWFELVDEVPAEARRVRRWDMAATEGDGDYTVGLLMAEKNGVYYIEDIQRGQWSSGERDKRIRATAERDAAQHPRVEIWGPQDPGQAGKDAAAAFVRLLSGFIVYTEPESGSKEIRAEPFAAQAEAGNVKVKRAAWTMSYLDELCSFPTGAQDDQVDSSSGAFNKLAIVIEAYGEAVYEPPYTIDSSY